MRKIENLDFLQQLFSPLDEDEFLPLSILSSGPWKQLHVDDVLLGTTTDEGTMFFSFLSDSFPQASEILATQYRTVVTVVISQAMNIPIATAKQITTAYFGGYEVEHTYEEVRDIICEIFADAVFNCPTQLFADSAAEQGVRTHRYLFAHKSTHSFFPEWMGVAHTEDLFYTVGSLSFLKDKSRYTDVLGSLGMKYLATQDYTSKEEQFMKDVVRRLGRLCANRGAIIILKAWTSNSTVSLSCLRKLDPLFIIRTIETLDNTNQVFAPEYGDEFFPEHPLAAKTWAKLPFKQVILGTTADEGTLLLDNIQYSSPALKQLLATDYRLAMTVAMQPIFGISISRARPIVDAYFGGPDVQHTNESVRKIASELLGDGALYCPVELMADIAARQGIDTYRYLFAYRSSHSFWPKWMGVTHGDDGLYVLGSLPFMKDKSSYTKALGDAGIRKLEKLDYTSGEENFMRQIVAIISSFVATGKPQLPDSGKEWPRYTPTDPAVLQLRPGNISEVKEKNDKCDLWRPHLLMQ
ncbi:hypothetical protein HPB50_005977 [Hyalomma asiaticum]|uniref:Uncharacterized protein n=1 Tax=Hyalomma asiaticum TaxID=266040 RepID=A0ACB7S7A8_HYAAI|nr:hypothetical protein HPB50_005977 [Hyalomma asiaticum]